MRIVLLGTGGYHPNERRHTACLMIPELGIIFDAGTSFFRVPDFLQTRDLQIFLTHAHLDHIVGLSFFLVPMLTDQVSSVQVFGEEAKLAAIQTHLFCEEIFPVLPDYEFISLPETVTVPGNGILRHLKQEHPGGSLGYRIDWPDRSLAYMTDTAHPEQNLEFVQGVDLLIHECYFPDEMAEWADKTGHSHTTPVANLARDSKAGKLILTHIDPQRAGDDPIDIKVAQKIFPNTILGEDLMEIDF
ncbi:MAG: metal-dependent hydrolase [Planctomycetes bacterium]|nr:metal-dependent hydrolase [Planctomycetota bacterium]MCH9726468.1 metal-dependent hydrolase [Planctomycetota bacterium]MCH9778277.1 metal-dependent hydrolase [Planctomycetota bacterium]MDF1744363.1 MBL fold metallo-hydrolase [Gimesia sp.]